MFYRMFCGSVRSVASYVGKNKKQTRGVIKTIAAPWHALLLLSAALQPASFQPATLQHAA
jgi:hypothetical protein